MTTPANPVASFADLTSYEAAQSGDPEYYLDAAVSTIRKYCGWHVSPNIREDIVLDGIGGTGIELPTLRLTNVLSIENDGKVIDLESVDISRDGVIELQHGSWSRRLGGIKLSIEHGFDEVHELTALANTIAARAAASPNGVIQEGSDGVLIRFSTFGGSTSGGVALMAHEYAILDLYRVGRY